jgi:hypothetical protein
MVRGTGATDARVERQFAIPYYLHCLITDLELTPLASVVATSTFVYHSEAGARAAGLEVAKEALSVGAVQADFRSYYRSRLLLHYRLCSRQQQPHPPLRRHSAFQCSSQGPLRLVD